MEYLNVVPDIFLFISVFILQGTAEEARVKVKQYFSELQESLKRQELAALTVVDTHLRERLAMLKQQQEDMAVLLSQISAVCYQV